MGSGYALMPSSIGCKLLSCGNPLVATTAMDLTAFVDVTGFESVLVVLVSAKLAAETGTNVTLTALQAAASDGTGATAINDRDGVAFSRAVGGTAAAGRACSMQIRTRGVKQYFSPAVVAAGAAVTCTVAVYGIGVRDTAEITGHWADEAGVSVPPGTYS